MKLRNAIKALIATILTLLFSAAGGWVVTLVGTWVNDNPNSAINVIVGLMVGSFLIWLFRTWYSIFSEEKREW